MILSAGRLILGLSIVLTPLSLAQETSHAGHSSHGSNTSTPPVAKPQAQFATDTVGLPEVRPSSEVRLNDGESFVMEAAPAKQNIGGQWIRRLAYNGSVPGPVFRVKQGSRVRITLKNSTEIATTLHPHGLRINSRSDGVPGIGQDAIPSGGSFEYELQFPDAGVYWYHPHVREDYSQDAGLQGLFIVEPSAATAFKPVHREIPLVLDDVLVDPKQAFQKASVSHTLMGRYGNVNLVNGTVLPSFNVVKGEVVRFFVLNSSNTRVFAFAIPGIQLKVVGGDNGLFEKEEWASKVVLGPGERAIIEARFSQVGTLSMSNAKPKNPAVLAQIKVSEGSPATLPNDFSALRVNAAASAEIAQVRQLFQQPVAKKLRLTLSMDHSQLPMDMGGMDHGAMPGMDHGSMPGMDHGAMPGMDHGAMAGMDHGAMPSGPAAAGIEWDDDMPDMNKASNNKNVVWKLVDEMSGAENMDIQWTFTKGEYVKIRIFNDPKSMHPMQHPIHFHGQRFLVAAKDGKVPANLVWKDTVLIPTGSTYDLLLEASNPGSWMGHCHISEHMEAQMMFGFSVTE